MNYSFYQLAILFLVYSFLGWITETGIATWKEKRYRNRGFVSGPFCFIYGLSGVLLTVFLNDLINRPGFLFLGSMIIATTMEWITGKSLERMRQKKWWDHSHKRWNFDGYICLQYSLLWGTLGFITVRYTNNLILNLRNTLPSFPIKFIVWIFMIMSFADILGSIMAIYHLEAKLPNLLKWNHKLQQWTLQFGSKIAANIEHRIIKAYPSVSLEEKKYFKEKCGCFQLFWLFFIGAFLGDIVETIFCRITAGIWMSRSSLVWGPFSIVWGLAIALFTALLYKDRNKPDRHIFLMGTCLGGAYEYICSIFTEIVFGKVFWDYSQVPFNLSGRINLLYCFFWGIAAVVWLKLIYPKLARLIELILQKSGKWFTLLLILFMIINIGVSILALMRYDSRAKGVPAAHGWERTMDTYFYDEKMELIYPNAKQR